MQDKFHIDDSKVKVEYIRKYNIHNVSPTVTTVNDECTKAETGIGAAYLLYNLFLCFHFLSIRFLFIVIIVWVVEQKPKF